MQVELGWKAGMSDIVGQGRIPANMHFVVRHPSGSWDVNPMLTHNFHGIGPGGKG